jgi:RecA/RadA recombinase
MQQENNQIWIKTGSTLLDLVVGGGRGLGYPAGKSINVVGDKSAGKTFHNCEVIAAAYHQYGEKLVWCYDDCESGFTFNTQELYGFEIMAQDIKDRFHSNTVQELYGNIRSFIDSLKKDQFGIYVVDSLDGLSSEELDEIAEKQYKDFKSGKHTKKGSYRMESAKFMSQEFFRTLTDIIQSKQVLVIFTSQIRHNIETFSFQKFTRSGGKALDFYCYSCLWLAHVQDITKRGKVVGSVVKAKTTRLKAPRPYRSCFFSLIFDYGLDNIASNIDYLYDLRTDTGKLTTTKAKLTWRDEEPMSRSELIRYIEDNELEDSLERRVIKKWEAEEEAVRSDRKRKYSKNKVASDKSGNTKTTTNGSAKATSSKTRTSTQSKKTD